MKYTVEEGERGTFWYKGRTKILHRENGPAVVYASGDQAYWLNGKLSREDGPALIYTNGYQVYYLEGKRHRLDGPAVIHPDGRVEYYIDDILLTENEFRAKTEQSNNQ